MKKLLCALSLFMLIGCATNMTNQDAINKIQNDEWEIINGAGTTDLIVQPPPPNTCQSEWFMRPDSSKKTIVNILEYSCD